jgi:hypothetical protein
MPTLSRYQPCAAFDATTYGDLAAMSGRMDYRQYRHLRFRSDPFGYPNVAIPNVVDVILLGDSIGAGTGTSQEKTWASLLRQEYGIALYNLSIPESGPWQELMTLKINLPAIRRRERTTVLWSIFSGNDLDDEYGPDLDPVLSGRFGQTLASLTSFRNRSPIRRIAGGLWYRIAHPGPTTVEREYAPGRRLLFRPQYVARVKRSEAEILAHPNIPRLRRVIAEMGRLASRENLSVTVLFVPAKEEVYEAILDERPNAAESRTSRPFAIMVKGECERAALAFLDLTPFMISAAERLLPKKELLWWSDDTHWNERGHALAAEVVYSNILMRTGH